MLNTAAYTHPQAFRTTMAQPSPGKTPTGVVIPRTTPTAAAVANVPDPDLRSEINAQLIKDGHIERFVPIYYTPP